MYRVSIARATRFFLDQLGLGFVLEPLPLHSATALVSPDRARYRMRGAGVTVEIIDDGYGPEVTSLEVDPDYEPIRSSEVQRPRTDGRAKRVVRFLEIIGTTLRRGRIAPEAEAHRLAVCTGERDGERVSEPCPSARHDGGHWYCGACGCSQWRLARLDGGKLGHPALECPDGHFSALTISGVPHG